MKGLGLFTLVATTLTTVNAANFPSVIYGKDDRIEVVDSGDNLMREKARSVAGMYSTSSLSLQANGTYKVIGKTLVEKGWCTSERFSNQVTSPVCTGWLAGPDILVTAGHCVTKSPDCKNYKWAFDYSLATNADASTAIPKNSVYSCKAIIASIQSSSSMNDYAVIRLDRAVTDRTPLEFRKSGKIANTTGLVLIGHPKGLPLKIAPGAVVRSNSATNYFVTNTDSYGGNSGSPIFDSATGIVEGILVRGETDTVTTSAGCMISNVCTETGCGGEDATRTTSLPKF
jgi:V8-like Glu-specific endopeptidase